MARPRRVQPVKLFVGLLSNDVDLLRRTRQLLARRFGPVDAESDLWPFDQTDYYEPEMGSELQRWFLTFERPIAPDALAEIKSETNDLEERVAEDTLSPGSRPVNIDPGYLDLGKVVLATTKDRSHRIYLSRGIFAEVTLHYVDGDWQSWPWTYPDYREAHTRAFFETVRERFKARRRKAAEAADGPEAAS